LIFSISLISLNVFCDEVDTKTSPDAGIKTINNIIIDPEKKEIRIKCKLAITEGILEFFLVDEAGNTYESAFKIQGNKPSELHFALLLLGFEPVPFPTYHGLLKTENALEQLRDKKCLLQLTLLKNNKKIPFSDIIRNREEGKNQEAIWVFTGASFTKDNKYTADYTFNYISIWPMPDSVINLLSSAGNPYRGDFGFEMAKNLTLSEKDNYIIILKEWNNEK
ncbi:MAG: hypothetical protein JXJ04_04950, partial [Spirochaetales bacterium]|nr:hypothetical protein [Spirochaetales bacterium]